MDHAPIVGGWHAPWRRARAGPPGGRPPQPRWHSWFLRGAPRGWGSGAVAVPDHVLPLPAVPADDV